MIVISFTTVVIVIRITAVAIVIRILLILPYFHPLL
jgi:hypothetical protein